MATVCRLAAAMRRGQATARGHAAWRCARRGRRGARRSGRPGWRRPRRRPARRRRGARGERGVQVVELVVGRLEGVAGGRVAVDEGVGGGPPELGGDRAHPLEHPAGGGGELGGQAGAGPLGDVLGQVARALELGDDADDGERVAELAGHGRLEEQQPLDVALDSTMSSSIVFSPARTLARASVSSPSRASLAAATASDTSANSRTTFWLMASRSRWNPTRSSCGCRRVTHDDARPSSSAAHAFKPLVVDLAVGGPADRVDRQHALRGLVGGQLVLHVDDDGALVERGAGHELHHRGDGLAELLVGDADGHRVGDGVVGLQHLLDLLGEHLLAAGVDAHRAAPEQRERAVGLDGGVVAGHRVALALEHDEGGGRLGLVLVVADRLPAAHGHPAGLAGAGLHLAAVVGDHLGVLADGELGRGARAGRGAHRLAHAERLGRGEGVDDHHPGVVGEQRLLGRLAEHHARARDDHEAREVVLAGRRVEGPHHRLGEGVADDGDRVHRLALDGGEQLVDVEVAALEGDGAARRPTAR